MIIAPALPTDVDGLVALVNSAYRGEAAQAGWTHEAGLMAGQRTDAASLRTAMAGGATILAATEAEGRPVGCVLVEPSDDRNWYLGMLTVDPARQAAGLGRALLRAGEGWARERGATRITMTVIHLRTSLIAYYGRQGYRLTGDVQPFPYGDERFGLPLRDDLHFVVLSKTLEDASSEPA